MSEIDYIYYNFLVHNNTNTGQLAEFTETRQNAILSSAKDWELAVCRFSIPSLFIPIFEWKPKKYWIGIQDGANPIRIVEVTLDRITSPSNSSIKNYVYNYQYWIDCVQSALNIAYGVANNPPPGAAFPAGNSREPRVLFNDIDKLAIIAPINDGIGSHDYFPSDGINGLATDVSVWMSQDLFLQFFSSLDYFNVGSPPAYEFVEPQPIPVSVPTINYKIRFVKRANNVFPTVGAINSRYPTLSFQVTENASQFPCTFAWTKLRRIIFSTTSIQVVSEQIGATSLGTPIAQSMITDFELPIDQHPLNRQTIFYQPYKYRYMSLLTEGEIRKMDVHIYAQTYDDLAVIPIIIPPGHDINIKLQFRRIRRIENLLYNLIQIERKDHEDENPVATTNSNYSTNFSVVPLTRTIPKYYTSDKKNSIIKYTT